MPPTDPDTFGLPPGTEIGKYTILEQIGSGGWGIVYKARGGINNRIVAIKEFYPRAIVHSARHSNARMQVTPNAAVAYQAGLEKFKEEARRLEEATHRSIVKALDYVEQNKTGYLIMSFVEGKQKDEAAPTLDTFVPLEKTMEPQAVTRLCDELLSALEYLHTNTIIHRDIAPDNILMAGLHNEDPMIIDLGGSRSVTAFLSNTMEALVKPGYTPLEQYASTYANPLPSADIYAAAAVLYRVISGENPVEAPVRALGGDTQPPLDPSKFPAFDRNLLFAIDKALSLHAANRPQSIAAWLDLMRIGPPPPPRRPSLLSRLFSSIAFKFALLAAACLGGGYFLANVLSPVAGP